MWFQPPNSRLSFSNATLPEAYVPKKREVFALLYYQLPILTFEGQGLLASPVWVYNYLFVYSILSLRGRIQKTIVFNNEIDPYR